MTNVEHLPTEEGPQKAQPPVVTTPSKGTNVVGGSVAMTPGAVLSAGALAGNQAVAAQMEPPGQPQAAGGGGGPAAAELQVLTVPASAAGFQLIGQTTWGKLKSACTKFNTGLKAPTTAKGVRDMQTQLDGIQKLVDDWEFGHRTDKGEAHEVKKQELARLRAELAANRSYLAAKLQEVTIHGDKDAFEQASFLGADFAKAEFTSTDIATRAWERWLTVPQLAAVFRYFVAHEQHETVSLNAWDDVRRWKAGTRSGASAKALFAKYSMKDTSMCNFSGEYDRSGGPAKVRAAREAIPRLGDDAVAPVEQFEPFEKDLNYVLWDLFANTFRKTPKFEKMTKAPKS